MGSLCALGDNLLGTVRDRIELLSIELQEEKHRLIQIFIWISAAAFTGMMAMAFASFAIVYLFWESARLAVLIFFALLYAGATAGIVAVFRRFLARQPQPLSVTLEELAADQTCIQKEH